MPFLEFLKSTFSKLYVGNINFACKFPDCLINIILQKLMVIFSVIYLKFLLNCLIVCNYGRQIWKNQTYYGQSKDWKMFYNERIFCNLRNVLFCPFDFINVCLQRVVFSYTFLNLFLRILACLRSNCLFQFWCCHLSFKQIWFGLIRVVLKQLWFNLSCLSDLSCTLFCN